MTIEQAQEMSGVLEAPCLPRSLTATFKETDIPRYVFDYCSEIHTSVRPTPLPDQYGFILREVYGNVQPEVHDISGYQVELYDTSLPRFDFTETEKPGAGESLFTDFMMYFAKNGMSVAVEAGLDHVEALMPNSELELSPDSWLISRGPLRVPQDPRLKKAKHITPSGEVVPPLLEDRGFELEPITLHDVWYTCKMRDENRVSVVVFPPEPK
jgi:hypothetical protein